MLRRERGRYEQSDGPAQKTAIVRGDSCSVSEICELVFESDEIDTTARAINVSSNKYKQLNLLFIVAVSMVYGS